MPPRSSNSETSHSGLRKIGCLRYSNTKFGPMMKSPPPTPANRVLETVVDQLPVGVILLDSAGKVIRFNRHEEYLSGLKRENVLGKSFFSDIAPCMEQIEFERMFREGIEDNGLDLDFEFNFPHRFNRVPRDVRIRASSVTGGPQAVHVVLIEDVTSKAQLQRNNEDMLNGLRSVVSKARLGPEGGADSGGIGFGNQAARDMQVVALSARVVGFNEFAGQLQPGELFHHIDQRLRSVTDILQRYGATIDSLTGEGVTAIFEVGEGQKQRGWFDAVRAGMEIATKSGNNGIDLRFAVGLSAGHVFNGPIGRPEFGNRTTIGQPMAVSRALAQVARPDEVLLEEAIQAVVEDAVEAEALRGFGVPGVPNHGSVFRLNELRMP